MKNQNNNLQQTIFKLTIKKPSTIIKILKKCFRYFIKLFCDIGSFINFFSSVIFFTLTSVPSISSLIYNIFNLGFKCSLITAICGISTGLVLALQSFYQLSSLGLTGSTGGFVAKAMISEIGPALTAFIFIGKIGSSITSSLCFMKVSNQVDVLKTMKINPIKKLAIPKIIACTLSMPILSSISALFGILGGFVISKILSPVSSCLFFTSIKSTIIPFDLFSNIIKSLLFGFLISTIASYHGLKNNNNIDYDKIGTTTTLGVEFCFISILISNFICTAVLQFIYRNNCFTFGAL